MKPRVSKRLLGAFCQLKFGLNFKQYGKVIKEKHTTVKVSGLTKQELPKENHIMSLFVYDLRWPVR